MPNNSTRVLEVLALVFMVAAAGIFLGTELEGFEVTQGFTENQSFGNTYGGPDQWPEWQTTTNVQIGDNIRQANLNSKGVVVTENITLPDTSWVQEWRVDTYYEGTDDEVKSEIRIWNQSGQYAYQNQRTLANGTNTFTLANVTGEYIQFKHTLTSGAEIQ